MPCTEDNESSGKGVAGKFHFHWRGRPDYLYLNQRIQSLKFDNPTQHPFFDREGGRVIYLEGSYVDTFCGNPHPTPYYEYNQIMYRLDLSDPRLRPPAGSPGGPAPAPGRAKPSDTGPTR